MKKTIILLLVIILIIPSIQAKSVAYNNTLDVWVDFNTIRGSWIPANNNPSKGFIADLGKISVANGNLYGSQTDTTTCAQLINATTYKTVGDNRAYTLILKFIPRRFTYDDILAIDGNVYSQVYPNSGAGKIAFDGVTSQFLGGAGLLQLHQSQFIVIRANATHQELLINNISHQKVARDYYNILFNNNLTTLTCNYLNSGTTTNDTVEMFALYSGYLSNEDLSYLYNNNTEINYTIAYPPECNIDSECGMCKKCLNNTCINQSSSEDLKNECVTFNNCPNSYTRILNDGLCNGLGLCSSNYTQNVSEGNVCNNGNDTAPDSLIHCSIWADCITEQNTALQYYVGYKGDATTNCSSANWVATGTSLTATPKYAWSETIKAPTCNQKYALFPDGDELSLKNSAIDTIVKIMVGFGAFAVVLGIFIAGALIIYGLNYARKK